jgi:serine/threonine-protein kinase
MLPETDQVLAGRFRVEQVLGKGGMGVVIRAAHLHLGQSVAVKLMLPQAAADQRSVQRFLREARAAARVRGDHVVRVLDSGTLDSGAPYIVMEYLDGRDLGQELARRGRLPWPEAVTLMLQASLGIAECHACGIVHRDLKPQNLMLTHDRRGERLVKVLDFGLSRFSDATDVSHAGSTGSGIVLGSPLYMAPERLVSERSVDPRSDVWALGAILYHLVVGRPPFSGRSVPELCDEILRRPPQTFDAVAAGLPEGLEPVILRCLEKDPAQRFQRVAGLVAALSPYCPAPGRQALAALSELRGGGQVRSSPGQHLEPLAQERRRRLARGSRDPLAPSGHRLRVWLVAVLAVGAVLATLGGVAIWWHGGAGPDTVVLRRDGQGADQRADRALVERLAALRDPVQRCLNRPGAGQGGRERALRLGVRADGVVDAVSLSPAEPALEQCLRRALVGFRFAPIGRALALRFPLP